MCLRSTLWRVMGMGLFFGGWMSVAAAQESAVEETVAEADDAVEATAENGLGSLTDRLVEIGRARVKQHELRIQALRQLGELHQALAKIRIKHTKAQLEEFHAQQEAARAELLMRESEFKRMEMLKAKNVVGDQAFHEAKSRRASANANVGKASAAVDRAEAEIRSAEFEREEMKLESALRISEATLALLDAQAELARTEHTQRRIRSMRFPGRTRGGREEDDAPTSSSDSSAVPPASLAQ